MDGGVAQREVGLGGLVLGHVNLGVKGMSVLTRILAGREVTDKSIVRDGGSHAVEPCLLVGVTGCDEG